MAWLVDDRLAARRGDDRENDLLGVYVIAAVLVLLSLTTEEANIAAAVGGALAGAVIGLLLPTAHPEAPDVLRRAGGGRGARAVRPERFADAERLVTAAAPQLHRVLGARPERGRLVRPRARVGATLGRRRAGRGRARRPG